jgi:hypothetical protein
MMMERWWKRDTGDASAAGASKERRGKKGAGTAEG